MAVGGGTEGGANWGFGVGWGKELVIVTINSVYVDLHTIFPVKP